MSIPAELKYTDTHEWVRKEADGSVSVGITHHAQDLLGDLVYVENPQVGREVNKGEECGVVESVKAASDIYAPVTGRVVAVNNELADAPERINQDAYDAWMFRLQPTEPREYEMLLDAAGYGALVESQEH
ncbi:MAG: glycine cleavage system protein GcvH [Betaproteobacteria bacterium]|jgi:glycine cleavage system H protein|nr:MAG: glycine cleavage system protein GcvH [Betaproteobacteria bacterium]